MLGVAQVATLMSKRGWTPYTSQQPACMAICLGQQHEECADFYLQDLRECTAQVIQDPTLKVRLSDHTTRLTVILYSA